MKVVVAAASRHGATCEIAETLGKILAEHALEVEVREPGGTLDAVDAVVLGSAVYLGKWLSPARDFAERHATELRERPTWLFSSGPIGDPALPEAEKAVEVAELLELTHAREHRLFTGRVDKSLLGLRERAILRAVGAPEGDFRDWAAVRTWGHEIAAALVDENGAASATTAA